MTFPILLSAALLLGHGGLATAGQSSEGPCTFTISSVGPFTCPAGELPDGQIRLNGSYPTETYSITNGGITDSMGFGCVITDPPTTQIQCDQGASPQPGFSIDEKNNLLYNGSTTFYACPATDTEYNIYLSPNFGQTKCIQIGLVASGCGAAPPVCPVSTVWQTQTVTQAIWQTITYTATSSLLCSTSTPSLNQTAQCSHCSKLYNSTWASSQSSQPTRRA